MGGALNTKTKMNFFGDEPWAEVWSINKKSLNRLRQSSQTTERERTLNPERV